MGGNMATVTASSIKSGGSFNQPTSESKNEL